MPLTGRQTTLDNHTDSVTVRRDAQDDLVLMFLCAGIPLEKINHPTLRGWLAKTTKIHGCIPVLSGDFPRQNAERLYFEQLSKLRELLANKDLALMFDEWTDDSGTATIAVIAVTGTLNVAIDVFFPEGHGKSSGVEHTNQLGSNNFR